MKTLRVPAMLLAAALQVLPICRTLCTSPTALSAFAIILRWGGGAAATLGAFDAVSGASVRFTCPTNATATVGEPFTFHATIVNYGGDLGAQFAALPMPPGLAYSTYDHPPDVYGIISGTPTQPTNNMRIAMVFSGKSGWGSVTTNLYLTVVAGSPPNITNAPTSLTVTAGATAAFSVGAEGSAPLTYRWRRDGNDLPGANSSTLTLAGVRTNQAGAYTVVVSNSVNVVTSAPAALLTVNLPASPTTSPQPPVGNQFRFSFVPVVGLTNSILTNANAAGATWGVWTNIPPPSSASSITITDAVASPGRFYRIRVEP